MTNTDQILIATTMRRFEMLICLGTLALLCGAGALWPPVGLSFSWGWPLA